MVWVWWRSVKHNDGRRPSGVGYNISRAHLEGSKPHTAACGREIVIRSKTMDLEVPPDDACSKCLKIASRR